MVAAVDSERNLAGAGHEAATAADASATPVGAFVLALVGALLGVVAVCVFRPGAVRLAAIPVTGCPAATLGAALRLDGRAAAGRLARRTALHAAARFNAAGRLCAAARLFVAGEGFGTCRNAGRFRNHAGTGRRRGRSLRELVSRGEVLSNIFSSGITKFSL